MAASHGMRTIERKARVSDERTPFYALVVWPKA